jgi:hypothetical protein
MCVYRFEKGFRARREGPAEAGRIAPPETAVERGTSSTEAMSRRQGKV